MKTQVQWEWKKNKVDAVKKAFKGSERQLHQTQRKQKKAAKTKDVVLSSSFCRLVHILNPKYTITSH